MPKVAAMEIEFRGARRDWGSQYLLDLSKQLHFLQIAEASLSVCQVGTGSPVISSFGAVEVCLRPIAWNKSVRCSLPQIRPLARKPFVYDLSQLYDG
jgi:hypothetical protein